MKNKKVLAIVQARLSSTRLPRKVLKKINNVPIIQHIFNRLLLCSEIDELVLATSNNSSDDDLEKWAHDSSVNIYRGSLDDVLDRYYMAALKFNADVIVRITGDCPLVDPNIVDQTVNLFFSEKSDLFSVGPDYPDGLDCQVISFQALRKAWKEAKLRSEREHVCPYIEKNPKKFKLGSFNVFSDYKNYRLTLDQDEDFKLIEAIYNNLGNKSSYFSTIDVINFLIRNPKLANLNSKIIRNEGYIKSVKSDYSV